ncbi:AAA family ATPase [Corynebacterium aquatimens]|uniref:Orc1-like AAA ATPase domain-containing protein n=1 Tax=Corynebacterium aquatimens TaxID=1190508 RepID=A0A931E2L1_9CORY|nr:ATP-binding protein [Corynebacterium aquatimens]MBG6122425.1 hypothetical protein [Corynebacterium aquatimens]
MVYGRESLLENIKRELVFLAEEPRLIGRTQVIVGPRGVGKTSLLRNIQAYASRKGFETVWVTAGDGPLANALVDGLQRLTHTWRGTLAQKLQELIASVRIEFAGVNVEASSLKGQPDQTGQAHTLQRLLTAAGKAAMERNAGLIVLIDEIQSADGEGLRALAYAWQHMQSDAADLAMATFAAGLSHSQDVITDAVSFAERFRYDELENLPYADAEQALRQPAEERGVRWSDEAILRALNEADGYPYFIQVIGDETWRAAGYPGAGTLLEREQVDAAMEGFRRLRSSFFRARWQKATPAEARMLRAMAELGEGKVKRKDITDAMNIESDAIGVARRSLLDKGLVDASSYGYLEFTAPGFAEFIRNEAE